MDKSKRTRLKIIALVCITLMAITTLIIYFGQKPSTVAIEINGTYLKPPIEIAQFNLIDNHGKALTKQELKGHWTLLFFGFTSCPMYCPTTLAVLNKTYKELEKDLVPTQLPKVLMVSVDPMTDTVERLNQFIYPVNPAFIGARADKTEIAAIAKQLHLAVSTEDLMNHSLAIVLLNPNVQVQAYFSYPQNSSQLLADYKLILKNHA